MALIAHLEQASATDAKKSFPLSSIKKIGRNQQPQFPNCFHSLIQGILEPERT